MNKSLMIPLVLGLVFLIPLVSAFGIVSDNWKENPLIMQPGESKDISFRLQNSDANDITIKVAVISGSEVVTMTDSSAEYTVPAGTADTAVNMSVNIPKNATIGTVYPFTVSFATVTSGAGGVNIGTGIEKNFDIVVGEVKEKGFNYWLWIAIVAAAIIIIWIIARLLRKK